MASAELVSEEQHLPLLLQALYDLQRCIHSHRRHSGLHARCGCLQLSC